MARVSILLLGSRARNLEALVPSRCRASTLIHCLHDPKALTSRLAYWKPDIVVFYSSHFSVGPDDSDVLEWFLVHSPDTVRIWIPAGRLTVSSRFGSAQLVLPVPVSTEEMAGVIEFASSLFLPVPEGPAPGQTDEGPPLRMRPAK